MIIMSVCKEGGTSRTPGTLSSVCLALPDNPNCTLCMCACCNICRVRLPINLETDRGVILGEGKPENQNHAIIFCHT
jgi:hypothetical protein